MHLGECISERCRIASGKHKTETTGNAHQGHSTRADRKARQQERRTAREQTEAKDSRHDNKTRCRARAVVESRRRIVLVQNVGLECGKSCEH